MARALWEQASTYLACGETGAFYEDALRDLRLREPHAFGVEGVTGKARAEIGSPEDIERARREVLPRIAGRDAA